MNAAGGSSSSLYWVATLCVVVHFCPLVAPSNTINTTHCDKVSPVPPTQCAAGYDCYHGTCYTDNGSAYNCDCDDGWRGGDSNTCCPLACSGHGDCDGRMEAGTWQFYCICEDSYRGDNCETERCMRQCKNGHCVFEGGTQVCRCKQGFSGDHCEDVDLEYLVPLVGTLATLGVLLVLVGILMPYVMWRQRALIILRVHYFIKRYRDNDSLPYDVFISCTSNSDDDLDFVREVLCPTLESSMGYSVCYGDRDFGAGSLIDSVCEAVRSSRRTILLLSPDYVNDTWPNFEVQIAQHESLRSAHRIIPIIYRKIDTISQPTLRNVISSLQCLKWPQGGNKRQLKAFWKKLRVLMPKVKVPEERLIWYSEV